MEEQQNEEIQERQTPVQNALRSGAIWGAIGVIIVLLLYVVDTTLMIKWWFGLIMLGLSIGYIIYAGILNKGQSLYFNYESKRKKILEYDDLKAFMMDKSRRGKKIDKKFLLENVKTTYNIE